MDLISSFTNDVVGKALDGTSQRHTAIASNLANVDTPGYQKLNVAFEGQLQAAIGKHQRHSGSSSNGQPLEIKRSRSTHLSSDHIINNIADVQPLTSNGAETAYRNDDNGVDVETEMVSLAKNTQRYLALTNIQRRLMSTTRTAITGG